MKVTGVLECDSFASIFWYLLHRFNSYRLSSKNALVIINIKYSPSKKPSIHHITYHSWNKIGSQHFFQLVDALLWEPWMTGCQRVGPSYLRDWGRTAAAQGGKIRIPFLSFLSFSQVLRVCARSFLKVKAYSSKMVKEILKSDAFYFFTCSQSFHSHFFGL